MFRNYLIITFRNIARNKGYTLLNIFGLAIGVASFLFILMYVQFELSYDAYHDDADNIYRVSKSRKTESRQELFATSPMAIAQTLKQNFPEVIEAARCGNAGNYQVQYRDKRFVEENTGYADTELFKLLKIPIIYGNPQNLLSCPHTVVITSDISRKYFGDENPVGETIIIDNVPYSVDGVIENFPANTHLKKDFLLCFDTVIEMMNDMGMNNKWSGFNCMNYIKLSEKTDPVKFEEKIRFLAHEYNGKELNDQGVEMKLFLQPIKDIHLYSDLNWEAEPPGNINSLYIFSVVGFLILLLGSMNYMNLMTARASSRALEVGVRKVAGAGKVKLITQFLTESLILTLLAVIVAVIIISVLLPSFNSLTELELKQDWLIKPENILLLLVLTILVGFLAGCYPAFILSGFKPVSILKGYSGKGNQNLLLRKILVVSQFAISITLITGIIVFFQQVNYMKNSDLGFDKEQKLIIEFDRSIIDPNSYESVKQEFLENPAILNASFSSSVPGRWMYFWHLHPFGEDDNDQMINCFQVDYDFIKEYELEIAAGRAFDKQRGIDRKDNGWIINEAAVKTFGWNDNKEALNHALNRESAKIIGVVKDFHIKGLQNKIEPLAIFLINEDFRYLTLNVNIQNTAEVINFIKEKHASLFPNYLFDFFFLDEDFEKQYQSEETMINLFGVFTLLAIVIAAMGLFGLAAYLAEKRTKEIGIRKVLGAGYYSIVSLLTIEFLKWVLIANIIAWPASYILLNKWLENFTYRIELELFPFFISAISALIVAISAVSYQTLKAALANPVKSLKYE